MFSSTPTVHVRKPDSVTGNVLWFLALRHMLDILDCCHGSTGPRSWVLWVLRPKTRWAQLLDNVQALDVGLPSVSRESGTMEEVERGLSSSGDQEIDC